MFNKVTSQGLEKEVNGIVSNFTSTISKLTASAQKATQEAEARRIEIANLEEEAKALDVISANAIRIADKIKSLLN